MFTLFSKTKWTHWTKILLLVILLLIVLAPQVIIAQAQEPTQEDQESWWDTALNVIQGTGTVLSRSNPSNPVAIIAGGVGGVASGFKSPVSKCFYVDVICQFNYLVGWILTVIHGLIFGVFLSLAALIFNITLNITVYSIKDFLELGGVIKAWSVIRDLCNMVFIFALLYSAVNIIIGRAGAGANKLIANIIIAALLVNFSGFFVRVAVDLSNLVAVTFNNEISDNRLTNWVSNANTGIGAADTGLNTVGKSVGLAANLIYATKLVNVMDPPTDIPGIAPGKNLSLGALVVGFIFSFIIGLIFVVILLYLSFVFLLRTLAIMIIFILSPAAIVGFYIPGGKSIWTQWWKHFQDNLLFAPLVLFNLYLVLLILGSGLANSVGNYTVNIANILGYNLFRDTLDALVFYIMAVGLLILGIKTAKSASGSVGAMAGTASSFASGALLGSGAGIASKYGSKLAKTTGVDKRLSNWYNGSNDQKGLIGGTSRQTARLARAIGRTEVGKKMASPISSSLGALGKLGVPGVSQTDYSNWSKRFSGENEDLDKQLAFRFHGDEEDARKMADKFKAFKNMSASDQKRLYSKLSAEDRSKLENEASKDLETDAEGRKKHHELIKGFRNDLTEKDRKELKKSDLSVKKEDSRNKAIDKVKDIFNPEKERQTLDEIKTNIRSLSAKELGDIFENYESDFMTKDGVIDSLTAGQLSELRTRASDEAKLKIRTKINSISNRPSSGNVLGPDGQSVEQQGVDTDDVTNKARTWLDSHPEF